jgi:hypothetical protein
MTTGKRRTRTPDGDLMISSHSSEKYVRVIRLWHFFCIHAAHATVISAPTQTETYQIPGGGPTHGTDGPLNVAFAIKGTLGDFDEQFLQVARALDPARARAPPDTDTNDLSTINVYTVGALLLSLSLFLLATY